MLTIDSDSIEFRYAYYFKARRIRLDINRSQSRPTVNERLITCLDARALSACSARASRARRARQWSAELLPREAARGAEQTKRSVDAGTCGRFLKRGRLVIDGMCSARLHGAPRGLRAVPTPPAISNMIVLDGIIDSSAENTTAEQQIAIFCRCSKRPHDDKKHWW